MTFAEARFERYALQAESLSQAEHRYWVDVDEIARTLAPAGFTEHDCQFFAGLLEDEGWARLFCPEQGKLRLKLTLQGYREIERLRSPRWHRWLYKNQGLAVAVMALVISIAALFQRFWL